MIQTNEKEKSYEYKRFMRDGSVQLRTAVVRSKKAGKNVQPKQH